MPTQEEEERVRKAASMRHWWPKLRNADVRTPDTEVYQFREWENAAQFSEGYPIVDSDEIQPLIDRVDGPPAFIRTDQASAKHDMASASRIDEGDDLDKHLSELLRHNHLAGFAGLPWRDIVVREWIDFRHAFEAFDHTPIAAEVRVFIHAGKMVSRGFYWPEDAIGKHLNHKPSPPKDWRELLSGVREDALNQFDKASDGLVGPVTDAFDSGYWSVDFALSELGDWYAIDMAPGVASWHPDSCEKPNLDGLSLGGKI